MRRMDNFTGGAQRIGLEETRMHLEALCDMRKPDKDPDEAVKDIVVGSPATVIRLKDHLEKRSQMVSKKGAL